MYKGRFLIFLAVLGFLFTGQSVLAREADTVTDWYIKHFETSIVVNKDSSLLITENITADVGNVPDKHGIFRVLPTQINTEKGVFKTPIELISITDFMGNPLNYETSQDWAAKTITWKIGDSNMAVTGEHEYKVTYKVRNAVRFESPDFDELYWNLLGTFWLLDIDNFSATVIFPPEIGQQNTTIAYYTGAFGSKANDLATYSWVSDNNVVFSSTAPLPQGVGITASFIFPKNIFTPYQFTFFEKYGQYFFWLLPLMMLAICFGFWLKYGKDPKMKKPIPPEFGIPEKPSRTSSRHCSSVIPRIDFL